MAKKRKALDALEMAAEAKAGAPADGMITTAVYLRRSTHKLLRAVAFPRAQEGGQRQSVSALIEALVDAHRDELIEEAGPFLR